MSGHLSSGPLWAAFLLASLVLAATPGPGVAYIVARTLAQGKRAGLASVAGVALGNLANAVGASLGLAALLAVSSSAFTGVKLLGAAYLVWLGIQALRGASAASPPTLALQQPELASLCRDGFWVALLNPKTAIFFAAFLPQFMDPTGPTTLQAAGLGAAFVAIAASTDTAYVVLAAWAAPALAAHQRGVRVGRWACAAVFIGLGVFTALSGRLGAR